MLTLVNVVMPTYSLNFKQILKSIISSYFPINPTMSVLKQ